MAELLSMGELLIDFTPSGVTPAGQALFARNPGGAPANVAVQAARVGVSAGFLGCVGEDPFGRFLRDTLVGCGVDTQGLRLCPQAATSLAFVQLNDRGDRDFSFYRDPGADTLLTDSPALRRLIDDCTLLCFGSLLLTAEPARSAVPALAAYARTRGKLTAYDPNWRPPLWPDEPTGVAAMQSLIPLADVMKVSGEELTLLTGAADPAAGARCLLSQGVSLVVVTLGPSGCAVFTPAFAFQAPTYNTHVVDTTGSGDSFFGALLARIVRSGRHPQDLTQAELAEFAAFANAAGALCATQPGAIPALPDAAAIAACRAATPLLPPTEILCKVSQL